MLQHYQSGFASILPPEVAPASIVQHVVAKLSQLKAVESSLQTRYTDLVTCALQLKLQRADLEAQLKSKQTGSAQHSNVSLFKERA